MPASGLASSEIVVQDVLKTTKGGKEAKSDNLTFLREKYEEKGPKHLLEYLKNYKPVNTGKLFGLVENIGHIDTDEMVGGVKNPNWGKRVRTAGSDEETRYNESKTNAQLLTVLLQKGFDGFTNNTQRNAVRNMAAAAVNAWPEAKAYYAKNPTALTAAVDKILKDPHLLVNLRKSFQGFLDSPENKLADETREADKKFQELDRLVNKLTAEKGVIATKLGHATTEYADFLATGAGTKGGKLAFHVARLTSYNTERFAAESALSTAQINLQHARANEHAAIQSKAPLATIATFHALALGYEATIATAQSDLEKAQAKISEYEKLEREKREVQEQIQTLEQRDLDLDDQLASAQHGRSYAYADLSGKQLDYENAEKSLANNIANVVTEASGATLSEKIDASEKAREVALQEEKANTPDPAEKGLYDAMMNRWKTRTVSKGVKIPVMGWSIFRKETNKYQKEAIDTDWESLMTKGPRELLENIMLDANNLGIVKLSKGEIYRKLKDSAFLEKMQSQVIETLLRRRGEIDTVSESDAVRIAETDWGEDIITSAMETDENVRAQVEKLRAAGKLHGSVREWLTTQDGKDLAWLAVKSAAIGGGAYLAGPYVAAGAVKAISGAGAAISGIPAWLANPTVSIPGSVNIGGHLVDAGQGNMGLVGGINVNTAGAAAVGAVGAGAAALISDGEKKKAA